MLHLTPVYAESYDKHFCNKHCYGVWQSKALVGHDHPRFASIEIPCGACGKILLRQPNQVKRGAHQFCNNACMGAWHSKHRSGVNSHFWRGGPKKGKTNYGPNWSAQRAACRKRDGKKCQHCGKSRFRTRRALDVHHIIPFRLFCYKPGENENYIQANDLTNLICLCIPCHRRAEAGRIPIQPKLL
jgi:hypothetical protein